MSTFKIGEGGNKMAKQKIRIRLKAYEHRILDQSADKIVETAKRTGADVSGPIPLPTERSLYTVIRATHKYKDSREQFEVGKEIKVDVFQAGDVVDVTGTTKGKGFQGAIKRHGQSRGPMSHGSRYHRRPGSMGPVAPNRVFKNKRLAGRMGGDRVTIQNLEVVKVDVERNVILIKGNIPGAKKSLITINSAVKAK